MSTMMESLATVSVTVGEQEITFETGKLAKQADGAVVVKSGDTMVLATAVGRMEGREGADFFPLTVDVEERMYAAGKIPGGFFKREGRPTERAILTARMIDRPIRPLWPKGYKNEVHVVCTTLSADLVTAHDILCINGASAALMVSPLPFLGPVGAVRIGLVDGEFVVNPTLPVVEEESTLDLIVVGSKDALTMIEAGADEIPEDEILEAFELAHAEIVKICDAQEDLRRQAGKPKYLDPELTSELESQHAGRIRERIEADGLRESGPVVEELVDELASSLSMESNEEDILRQIQVRASLDVILERARLEVVERHVREQFEDDLKALTEAEQDSKELKSAKRQLLFDRIIEELELPFPVGPATVEGESPSVKDSLTKQFVKKAAESIYKQLVREKIAVDKRRPDGRGAEDVREVNCEVRRRTANARLRALHTRPDADHVAAHAGHGEGRPADRRPLAGDRSPLHAPLQLPAVLGRRDRLHARAEAPRHRPRGARAAGSRADASGDRRVPVHGPDRVRDARVEWLVVDGLGLRLDACAHGRRACRSRRRWAASRWASSRRATTT